MAPNIVFIVLDAVRSRNLPFYNYHRNTMPFLSSMADDLAIYQNAVSSSYWTMPAMASLFTGTYASTHGLVVDGDTLDPNFITLPVHLKKIGYYNQAFCNNIYVSGYSGLDRGFSAFHNDSMQRRLENCVFALGGNFTNQLKPVGITRETASEQDHPKGKVANTAARLIDLLFDRGGMAWSAAFARWLRNVKREPFFCYFHIFETHSPYRAPLHHSLKFLKVNEILAKFAVNHDHLDFLLKRCEMRPADFYILQAAYDNAIAYADRIIKNIFNALHAARCYDDTLIVILADHGDNIGDHGLMFHYFSLYDTLIKIPLLIKYPTGLNITGNIDIMVQNVDIMPTILTILDAWDDTLRQQIEGNDLTLREPPSRESDIAVSELIKPFGPDRIPFRNQLSAFDRRLLSVRTPQRKFIYSSRGDHEAYNLVRDPDELHNLYAAGGSFTDLENQARPFYDKIDAFYQEHSAAIEARTDTEIIDDGIKKQLESLGYM